MGKSRDRNSNCQEVHPDARTYHNRTLPNVNDLFLIYGNDNTEQRQNYSGHSMDAEDYELGVNVGEEDYQSPVNNDPLRINWTREMDRYIIDLIKKFGFLCDKDVLEDRYWSLRKEYTDITDILNHNGFAWDGIRQTMTADDDVWEAYIKDHPDAVTYRDKILGDYCDLCVIYGKESQHSRSSYSDIKMEINTNTLGMGIDDIIGDTQSPVTEFEISHLRRKRKSAPSSTSACIQKVRRTIKKETQEAVEGKPCVVKTYLGTEEDKDYSSIECIVAALQTVPDMDDEIFLEACELLEDERKAKMFVAMDVTARRKWLLKKLRR
nr:uncharacterized protein CFP56_54583 [Quercus suber]